MTQIYNFFAGPGAGKSTMAAGLFYELKMAGKNVELVTEYAKDLTWEKRHDTLGNQAYVFGKQYHRLSRLLGKVDAIITDSPILLSYSYAKDVPDSFKQSIVDIFKGMNNYNFFVRRRKIYNPIGRNQTEDESKAIDNSILELLGEFRIKYEKVEGTREGLQELIGKVLENLTKEN